METTPEAPPVSRLEQRGVAVAAVVLVAWACWRTQFGADLGDGAHSVVLAIRLAEGAMPFADEMNAQSTGSVLAVPFTWLWLHVVGTGGIVLASRLFFVALSAAAGYLAYRALRPSFRPWVAFGFPALALVPTSFNLMYVNYTTAPSIAMVVALAAAHATVVRGSVRWAPVAGLAGALSGFSHPAAIPSALLFLAILLVLARSRQLRLLVLAGAAAFSFVVLVWLAAFAGVSGIRETLDYTTDYQAFRMPPSARLQYMKDLFSENLVSWRYLPMWVLGLGAMVPRIGPRTRAVLLLLALVAASVPSFMIHGTVEVPPQPFGRYSGLYATIVAIALCVPASLAAYRARDRSALVLLGLAVPPALVALPILGATSSASPLWGAAATCVTPAFGVVAAVPSVLAPVRDKVLPAVVVVASLVTLTGVHMLFSFRDVAPWNTDARISGGPYAGVRTTTATATGYVGTTTGAAIRKWSGPHDSVYVYDNPGAYLWVRGTIDTNIVWTPRGGASNQVALDYFAERGGYPDVVFMFGAGAQEAALGEAGWRATDPLVEYFYAHYDKVDTGASGLVVLRKRT